MNNYVPFLKLKVNEVGALKELEPHLKIIVPFFDFPRQKDGLNETDFRQLIEKSAKKVGKHLKDYNAFFIDNVDIDDSLSIDGENNYAFAIRQFADFNFIPVVGLDRAPDRNQSVFDLKKSGIIKNDKIALRVLPTDFLNFDLISDEIEDIHNISAGLFKSWTLILDNRVCDNIVASDRAKLITEFAKKYCKKFPCDEIIVTGSSIPASIKDVLDVESEAVCERLELQIYREVASSLPGYPLALGDYTIVSPLYSDFKIPPAAMRNIMTPKIFYPFDDFHFIARGGALKSHARGDLQYNDIAKEVISKPFYRKSTYSFGDKFLYDKAHATGGVTPSSIVKPLINAHITYMFRDYSA